MPTACILYRTLGIKIGSYSGLTIYCIGPRIFGDCVGPHRALNISQLHRTRNILKLDRTLHRTLNFLRLLLPYRVTLNRVTRPIVAATVMIRRSAFVVLR